VVFDDVAWRARARVLASELREKGGRRREGDNIYWIVNGPLSMLARGSLLLLRRRNIVLTCFLISESSASDWSSSTEAARGTPSRRVICVDFTMLLVLVLVVLVFRGGVDV
jgi:hypothetical protein